MSVLRSTHSYSAPSHLWQLTQADEDLKNIVQATFEVIKRAKPQYEAALQKLHLPLQNILSIVSTRCSALSTNADYIDNIDNDTQASDAVDGFISTAEGAGRALKLVEQQSLPQILDNWDQASSLSAINAAYDVLSEIERSLQKASSKLGEPWPFIVADGQPQQVLREAWSAESFTIRRIKFSSRSLREACQLQDYESIMAVYDKAMESVASDWCLNHVPIQDATSMVDTTENLRIRSILHDAAARLIQGTTLPLPVSIDELSAAVLSTDVVDRWTNFQNTLNSIPTTTLKDERVRICVYGLMNHGKSSFINALIGEAFLHTDGNAVTRWPLIVRHRSGISEPTLTISEGHFEDFLSKLRDKEFHLMLTDDDPRIGDASYVARYHWLLDQDPEMKASLETFSTNPDPFDTSPITGRDRIKKTLISINILMELCKELFNGEAPNDKPVLLDSNWPILEVAFDLPSNDVPMFELVDLPGQGEHYEDNSTLPTDVQYEAIRKCHAAIYVVQGNFLQGEATFNITAILKEAKREPPLSVFATHADGASNATKIIREAHWAAYRVRNDLKRVCRCAPGVYSSAREGYRFALKWKEKEVGQGYEDPELDKPPFEAIWAHKSARTAYQMILGSEEYAKMMYGRLTCEAWLSQLHDLYDKKWTFNGAMGHFLSKVLQDGKDRRTYRALEAARRELPSLLSSQGGLLYQAHVSFADVESAKKKIRDFEAQASQKLREWRVEHAKFKGQATEKLKTRLKDAQTDAWKSVKDVIYQVAAEHFDNHDPDSVTVTVKSRTELVVFLEAVGKNLKAVLSSSQREVVDGVKTDANDAWRSCLRSLGEQLSGVDNQLAPYFMNELTCALNDRADAMDETIYNEIRRNLMKKVGALTPDAQAVEEAMSKSWIPHQQAQAAKSKRVIHVTEQEASYAEEVNKYGFLLRPEVSGSRLAPHVVTETNVASLTEEFPATISVESVAEIHREHVVTTWKRVLDDECTDTLYGTIDKSSSVGYDTVRGHLDQWLLQIGDANKVPKALSHEQLENLVRLRAQGIVARNTLDTICKGWERTLGLEILRWR